MANMGNYAGYMMDKSKAAPDADPNLEKQPPNQDAITGDVVRDPRRLSGAKGLAYLKSRSA